MSQVCWAIIICSETVVEQTINLSCKHPNTATFWFFFSLTVSHLIHLNLQRFLGITINLKHPYYLGYHFLKEVFENYWFTTAEKRLEMCGDFQILYSLHLEMNYRCIQRTVAYSTWTKGWVINFVLIWILAGTGDEDLVGKEK